VLNKSSLTICATGDYPTEAILAMNPRYIFLDAPLGRLADESVPWSPLISPLGAQ
jgi:hypothetical protein